MTFMGYRRPDGTAGTRNYVAVLPTINCVNDTAYQMCGEVPGTIPLLNSLMCTHFAKDKEKARRGMAGILRNPNIYAAVILGVGDCEPYSAEKLASEVESTGKPFLVLSFKDYPEFDDLMEKGVEFLRARLAEAETMEREPCEVSNLTLATKCGGSGAVSILANNASVGRAVDILVENGGSAMFSETAELLGVEKVMAARCATPEVAKKLLACVERVKAEIDHYGVDIIGSEPVPGNIKAGLSTIEEKSLGSTAKSGTTPILDVLEYAEPMNAGHGVYFMDCDSAGESIYAGMMAVGAQIGVHSLAGGGCSEHLRSMVANASGLQVLPTIKLLGSNSFPEVAKDFDVYVGDILSGTMSIDEGGEKLFNAMLAVASGERTFTEKYCKYYGPLQFFRNGLLL